MAKSNPRAYLARLSRLRDSFDFLRDVLWLLGWGIIRVTRPLIRLARRGRTAVKKRD